MLTAGAAGGGSLITLATTGAIVLGVLLALAAGLGVYAAFRTGRTNALLTEYKAIAETAGETAETWKSRSEAIQAELAALQRVQKADREAATAAAEAAGREIRGLQAEVATLRGVVSARQEILDLQGILTTLHQRVHDEHVQILDLLGGPSGRTSTGAGRRRRGAPAAGNPPSPADRVDNPDH